MIAGIVIDNWKLEIFRKHLQQFKFTEHPGLTPKTLLLKVECDSVEQIKPAIEAAEKACRKRKMQ